MAGGIVIPSPYPVNLVDYGNDGEESDEEDPDADAEGEVTVATGKTATEASPVVEQPTPPDSPSLATPPVVSSGLSAGMGALGLVKAKSFTDLRGAAKANGSSGQASASKKTNAEPRSAVNGGGSPPRVSEKRRREEEEEEPLGLLAASAKQKVGKRGAGEVKAAANKSTGSKGKSDGPSAASSTVGGIAKKIKLSLGKTSFGIASSSSPAAQANSGSSASSDASGTSERENKAEPDSKSG